MNKLVAQTLVNWIVGPLLSMEHGTISTGGHFDSMLSASKSIIPSPFFGANWQRQERPIQNFHEKNILKAKANALETRPHFNRYHLSIQFKSTDERFFLTGHSPFFSFDLYKINNLIYGIEYALAYGKNHYIQMILQLIILFSRFNVSR
ncbi:MAG: hypothetical protein ACR65R_08490 [Methylomicrobium sp.]